MIPKSIQPNEIGPEHLGLIITRDQPTAGKTFRKGHVIGVDDLSALAESEQRIHAVQLGSTDVTEVLAVPRIAAAIIGEGAVWAAPVQGRSHIRSTRRGLLQVDERALLKLNSVPDIGVFTHHDGLAVDKDALIAGVKIAPVAIDIAVLDESLSHIARPVIDVEPFLPLRVHCLVTESISGRVRDRFEQTLRQKIDWYGGTLQQIEYLEEDFGLIATAMSHAASEVDLILTAGSHMMDPLDPILRALGPAGAELIRMGAPAHPGSMVWAARHIATETPILSIASCSMFSRSTVADLLLPLLFAGKQITNHTFAKLGHGGLLDRGMDWRFPPYEVDE